VKTTQKENPTEHWSFEDFCDKALELELRKVASVLRVIN
jgi:hypothetical protein